MTTRTRRLPQFSKAHQFLKGFFVFRDRPDAKGDEDDYLIATERRWYGDDPSTFLVVKEDFLAPAGTSLPAPWAKQDTSAAGSPVSDYVDATAGSGSNGAFNLALAADNEVESLTLYWGDYTPLGAAHYPYFETTVLIRPDVTGASGDLAAGDVLVFGLASNRNATHDDITLNAWFRMEGANKNILWETDDDTTDDDDNDTGVDWVADTAIKLAVDFAPDPADATNVKVRFYVDDVLVGTSDMDLISMITAAEQFQPYIEVTKAAAANSDHDVLVDYVVAAGRKVAGADA